MQNKLMVMIVPIVLLAAGNGGAQDYVSDEDRPFLLNYPNIEDSDGRVVLTNEHVVLQRLVVGAGEWEGVHSHPGNQIYVHIKGGEWSGRLGGELAYSGSISPDGGIGWMDKIPLSAGHDSGNTGDTDIDLIYVTLKSETPIATGIDHMAQTFPDIPTELVLENERMIVQRVRLDPGQWTGVHSHPGNQVYLQIKSGSWSQRRHGMQAASETQFEAGAVGWLDAIDISEEHDVGNTGNAAIEFVLVTIK